MTALRRLADLPEVKEEAVEPDWRDKVFSDDEDPELDEGPPDWIYALGVLIVVVVFVALLAIFKPG